MEQCELSPFSSPGASSLSSRCRKTLSPRIKDQKEKKNTKSKPLILQEKPYERKKG